MITSDLMTLRSMVEEKNFFTVPIYQRLYVWEDEQVKTLLDDLVTAFQANQDIFYLGGTLVMEYKSTESGTYYELIDGQQRFTTLWMMSLVWREALEPFLYRQEKDGIHPRVTFAIRPKVDLFFAQRINGIDAPLPESRQIVDALATIESYLKDTARGIDPVAFTRFIYDKVKMVLTRVPAHADLNKLFEVINSRGVQLQHHEILKGKLLGYLSDPAERERYALLWDASAAMDDYVEKSLREIADLKVADLFTNETGANGKEKLASANAVLDALANKQGSAEQQFAVTLDDILTGNYTDLVDTGVVRDQDADESYDVRSIISFPMLLQHVLRIWLHRHQQPDLPKILDKELLGLFEQHFFVEGIGRDQVISFIELLWEVRYCFDKYIIKWVMVGEEEQHLVCPLRLNPKVSGGKTYYSLIRQQPTGNDGFALLQSMLYHSQQITTHYWLTPLLAYMHSHPGQPAQHFAFLRHLDNHLLCNNNAAPLVERSYAFLQDPWQKTILNCSQLEENLGVAFPHYWFYKLEFVLWYLKRAEMNDSRWEAFRMTAKNSVEHISPQTPQVTDMNRVSDRWLNSFGNLALVARSINSEYGNLPFNEKRQRFINRNATRFDSLKMALIYNEHAQWNDTLAAQHQHEMIQLVNAYFSAGSNDGTTQTPEVAEIPELESYQISESETATVLTMHGFNAGSSEEFPVFDYWKSFIQFLHRKSYANRLRGPRKKQWVNFWTEYPGLLYSVGFDLPGEGQSTGRIWVQFTIESRSLQDRYFEAISAYKDEIEAELQQKLDWRNIGFWGYRIGIGMSVNLYNQDEWDEQFAWMHDQLVRLRAGFDPRLDSIVAQCNTSG